MLKPSAARTRSHNKFSLRSFTIIELLVVMAIIAILVGMTIAAANGVIQNAARNRAKSEIQAIATKLEDYKSDNGAYPSTATISLTTNNYTSYDGTAGGVYQQTAQILYMALSGKTNFLDTPASGTKSYMAFRANQVGNSSAAAGTAAGLSSSYVMDPWGYSYGYSTGTGGGGPTTNYPYNGNNLYDLWSTGGVLAAKLATTPSLTNAWISNYQP